MTRLITEIHFEDLNQILTLEGYLYDPTPGKQIIMPKGTFNINQDLGYNVDSCNDWIIKDCVVRKIKVSRN
jgi:hypothetical protein